MRTALEEPLAVFTQEDEQTVWTDKSSQTNKSSDVQTGRTNFLTNNSSDNWPSGKTICPSRRTSRRKFFNWQSWISRQICNVFSVRVHEGALNDALNYAQKGCAMQVWGITLKCINKWWWRSVKNWVLILCIKKQTQCKWLFFQLTRFFSVFPDKAIQQRKGRTQVLWNNNSAISNV